MKRNFVISVICIVLCFILLVGAIVLNVLEYEEFCMYAGMASSAVAFIAVLFGLNSWKEK